MSSIDQYQNKLDKLQNYLDFAIDVSNASGGQKNVPWYLVSANQLFIRMTITCTSFIRLCPFNRLFPADIEFWDLHSLLSIARNFIESYLMFYYIGVEPVSEDESKLRYEIFTYHTNIEKYKLYKDYNAPQADLEEFETKLPIDKERIKENELFNSIVDRNMKDRVLKGNTPAYLSNLEIVERLPFETYEFKPFYRWFSNHTHSTPLAVHSLTDERGSGNRNEAELAYVDMAIDFITKYLVIAIVNTIDIFPHIVTDLNATKLEIIRREYIVYSQNL